MFTIKLTEHTTETGHRIPHHEGGAGKCARLHGHTYRYNVTLAAEVLEDDFVVDFGDVKKLIDRWDHRFLLWKADMVIPGGVPGVLIVDFIPTAERMAERLARDLLLEFDTVAFAEVEVWETAKTMARYYLAATDLRVEERRETGRE